MSRLRLAFSLLLVPAVLWLAGFAWFLHVVGVMPPPPIHADGIIALTGGADRLEEAFRLLAEGRAPRLLVSGVAGEASLGALTRRVGGDAEALSSRVTLGRAARSTLGNARESAAWAHENGLRSVIVVTANYHMPRALLEMRRAMPDVALLPVPVVPPAMRGAQTPLGLLAGEYTKLIGSFLGVAGMLGTDRPA